MRDISIQKTFLIHIHLLALLFSVSCNNSNKNEYSNKPTASIPVKYYKESGFAWLLGPAKVPDELDKEAGKMMKNHLENAALKSEKRDSWFLYLTPNQKDLSLVEVTIDSIVVVAVNISPAARQNGLEWAGTVGIHTVSYRSFDKEKGWTKWFDSKEDSYHQYPEYPFDDGNVKKANGEWDSDFDKLDGSFSLTGRHVGVRKPRPEEIPK